VVRIAWVMLTEHNDHVPCSTQCGDDKGMRFPAASRVEIRGWYTGNPSLRVIHEQARSQRTDQSLHTGAFVFNLRLPILGRVMPRTFIWDVP